MHEQARLTKLGDSLAIIIPKSIAKQVRMADGDSVALEVANDGTIVLRPSRRAYLLDELVSAITDENRHEETNWSPSVGKEVW